jgi:hypothetical protein
MVILLFAFPSAKEIPHVGNPSRLNQLDYLGAILNGVASLCFVFCLQEVGTRQFRWNSVFVISLLTLSGVAAVLFCIWQWFISSGNIARWILPQLPFRIMKNRALAITIV